MNFFAPQIFRTSYSPAAQVRSNQPLTFATKYCVVVCNYMGYNLVITTPFSALFLHLFSLHPTCFVCRNIVCYLISFFLTFLLQICFYTKSWYYDIQFRAALKYLKVCRPGTIDRFSNVKFMYCEKATNFAKSSPYFWLALHRTKGRWRLHLQSNFDGMVFVILFVSFDMLWACYI